MFRSWEVFNKYAHRYDSWYFKNYITAINELKVIKSLVENVKTIDIGCGTGWFTSQLNTYCIGIDPSIEMIKIAKSREIDVICSIGEKLPIKENSVNQVLVIVTLCFVDNPELILQECYRILKRNGKLIICVIPKDSKWGEHYISKRKDSPFYEIAHFLTRNEVKELTRRVGFEIIEIKSTIQYLPNENPKPENPADNENGNFVCYKCVKIR